MNDVLSAACEVQVFMRQQGWRFCVIGGLALIRWGQPRSTADVDITLLTGYGDEDRYLNSLLQEFEPRITDARNFATINRVLLLKASNGVGIDIALAGFPFEERLIERSSAFEYSPGAPLWTASAEDLLVLKAFANRPQDWVDIQGIIVRQGTHLRWSQIDAELLPLCELKEAPEIVDRLIALRQQLQSE
jgi:hypothetical protein